nr:flippase [uncultured Desulfobacter sp.]
MMKIIQTIYLNLMSNKNFSEILSGSVWALGARVISTALALIISVVVARFYGAEAVGTVAVINSFLMLASIFTVLGTDTSILRLIPEHLAKYSPTSAFKLYRKTQYMVICISAISSVFFFFSANLIADKIFSKPHLSFYFALSSGFIVFQSIMKLNTQAVRGLKLIKLFALMQFLPQVCNLFLLIVVGMLWASKDVPVYAVLFSFTITGIVGWFIMELVFNKKMEASDIVSPISWQTILSISRPMLMSTSMLFLMGQTSILMLNMFQTEADVGLYSIAVKLSSLTSFVLQAINALAAPKFSELFQTNKIDELFYVGKKTGKLIFLTTTPPLLVMLAFGKPILSVIYGPLFLGVYPVLIILIVGQFIRAMAGSTEIFLNMTGNEKALRNIMLLSTIINLCLNYLFINNFGVNGAAWATMLSIVFCNICLVIYTKIYFKNTIAYVPFIL